MSLSPLDLLPAHPWQRVAFTTYALSLSFFEAVVLDALVRGGVRAQPVILADVQGVRDCLSEQGARLVGRDYEVEPISVFGGVFHPKITVLVSDTECHLLVGSGNLTFNGWGGNCEVIEHLHSGFAATAIADAAEFFELLPRAKRVRQGAGRQCSEIASSLRRSTQGRSRSEEIRFLHNLESSLIDQIVQSAAELGGARRLIAAAPFWDSGAALDRLCGALSITEACIHVHSKGTVDGFVTDNWPRAANTRVHAVRVAPLDASAEAERRLHAKVFEILCRRGRLLITGSANGTCAALDRDGNIEACVLRILRDPATGWSWVPGAPPEPTSVTVDGEKEELNGVGILRAVLNGDQVTGQVLTPRMDGAVSVYHLAALGPELLANAVLDSEGAFCITALGLEKSSWRGGRLVLRVTDPTGRQAEGFVSLANFAEIARRGGHVAPRLLALIFGNDTPEDITAILSWFVEDPKRLSPESEAKTSRGGEREDNDSETLIPLAALGGELPEAPPTATAASGDRHWSRFLDQVFAAFRQPREAFHSIGDDSTEDGEADEPQSREKMPDALNLISEKTFGTFSQLFELLTKDDSPPRYAEVAFDLTGYICARLTPELIRARAWLVAVIRAWLNCGVRSERREDVAAAILTVLGTAPDADRMRWARHSLLRLGRELSDVPPPAQVVHNYQTVLLQRESFADLWEKVREVRTLEEQLHAYVKALKSGAASPDSYRDLPDAAPEVWPVLAQALTSIQARMNLIFIKKSEDKCPIHYTLLPRLEIDKLQTVGIAMAKNCCGRVIIRLEA